ncbi:MAG TPA: hypothetical protein VF323_12865 [Candidatus Limnocylindrales bacterium]
MGLVVIGILVLAAFVLRVALFRRTRIVGRGRRLMGPFAPVRRIARRRRWR